MNLRFARQPRCCSLIILGLCSLGWGADPQSGAGLRAGGPVPLILWDTAVLRQKPEWYGSAEARSVADSVIQYQSPQGGWPKSTDLAVAPRSPEDIPPPGGGRANSIDNDATTLPMQFLALVVHATGEARYREAFARGVDYLLAAQYPNGGWPQFFPLRDDYYSRITYNDDAMVRVLIVLRDAAAGKPPYAFVDEARRAKAGAAVARGIDTILRTQVKQDGKLTAWCAQHDEKTLAPAWARTYEPPSLSGSESVGIVRFLMEIEQPTPEMIAAIEGAVAWFRAVAISGLRLEDFTAADGKKDKRIVADPAGAPLWARFYELGTNRPIFLGRDSVVRYTLAEIEHERRNGYAYYGTWPATLLAKDYPRWREKHRSQPGGTADRGGRVRRLHGTVDLHSCWRNVMLRDAPHSTHSGKGAVDTRNEVGSHVEVVFDAQTAGPRAPISPDLSRNERRASREQ